MPMPSLSLRWRSLPHSRTAMKLTALSSLIDERAGAPVVPGSARPGGCVKKGRAQERQLPSGAQRCGWRSATLSTPSSSSASR